MVAALAMRTTGAAAMASRACLAVSSSTWAFTSRMRGARMDEVEGAVLDRPIEVVEAVAGLGHLCVQGRCLGAGDRARGVRLGVHEVEQLAEVAGDSTSRWSMPITAASNSSFGSGLAGQTSAPSFFFCWQT